MRTPRWPLLAAALCCLWVLPSTVGASTAGGAGLDAVEVDLHDRASLQRGAGLYMNYCLGCHGLRYQRYQRLAQDLGVPDDLVVQQLIFDDSRVGSLIETAMPPARAAEWFGESPPDLSLSARVRGADWLYTYLRSFYADPSRPWGVNNTVFADVGMPHALLELQGMQYCAPGSSLAPNGGVKRHPLTGEDILDVPCGRFQIDSPGSLSVDDFDSAVRDLANRSDINVDRIKVISADRSVYLLGNLPAAQRTLVGQLAGQVPGVRKVINQITPF